MKLKAKKPLRYAGKRLAVGESFETKGDLDAKILTATGQAEYDEAPKPRRGRPPKGKDFKTLDVEQPRDEPPKVTSTEAADALFGDGRYLRRDLRPEE